MKPPYLLFALLLFTLLQGCCDKPVPDITVKQPAQPNPRFATLDPYAWKDLPMALVIADFQNSDGVYSSFICDELYRRLQHNTGAALEALSHVDKQARRYTLKPCFSAEYNSLPHTEQLLKPYVDIYPDIINEINPAGNGS